MIGGGNMGLDLIRSGAQIMYICDVAAPFGLEGAGASSLQIAFVWLRARPS